MLSFLNANGRPSVQVDYERIKPYSTFGETAGAAMRSAARISTPGVVDLEHDIAIRAAEDLEANYPEEFQEYQAQRRRLVPLRGMATAFQRGPESYHPRITKREDLQKALAERGLEFSKEISIPTGGLTVARAVESQKQHDRETADRAIMENAAPGLAGLVANVAGGLIGSIADPINLVPLGNGLNRARMLAQGTRLLSRAGLKTLGRSAAIGAAEGAGGAFIADAAVFPYANQWGADLGWEELAADMAFSGILGAGFSTLGTAIGPRKAASLHQDALTKAAADAEMNRAIDVGSVLQDWESELRTATPYEVRRRIEAERRRGTGGWQEDPNALQRARDEATREFQPLINGNVARRMAEHEQSGRGGVGWQEDQNLEVRLRQAEAQALAPRIEKRARQIMQEAETLRERAGGVPGKRTGPLAETPERGRISFERAAPERNEIEARRFAEEIPAARANEPLATGLLDEALTREVQGRVAELERSGLVSPEGLADLADLERGLNRASRERSALLEAAECVIRNGI